MSARAPHPLDFFGHLQWLDGRPLLHTIERYRQEIFTRALYTFDPDGRPQYDRVLSGRAKKNWKTADLALAALYRFLVWPSAAGNDAFILANDEDQAGDDLALVKKLIACNPILAHEVMVNAKTIVRNDHRGTLQILPARDIAGSHGKTYLFIGFDEIHAYRNHDLFEALAPDPTRPACRSTTSCKPVRPAKTAGCISAGTVATTRPIRPSPIFRRSNAQTQAWAAGPTVTTWSNSARGCPRTNTAACI